VFYAAHAEFCTDNGAMIAYAGAAAFGNMDNRQSFSFCLFVLAGLCLSYHPWRNLIWKTWCLLRGWKAQALLVFTMGKKRFNKICCLIWRWSTTIELPARPMTLLNFGLWSYFRIFILSVFVLSASSELIETFGRAFSRRLDRAVFLNWMRFTLTLA